ncbi:DUF4870 domain-containing protein, partial [Coleofasciculus sp. LEGE 07081]|nr:DUF4870 domain-containing protein [Coleofasciculus sp. LEGE 07081]
MCSSLGGRTIMQDNHQDARNWGMLCHLASLLWLPLAFLGLAIPSANVVGPLIVWLYKKGDDPFVNNHGKESLNFQISMTIYGLILFVVVAVFALIYLAVVGTAASTE